MERMPEQGHGRGDDPLAYGDYHGQDPEEIPPNESDYDGGEGERGIIGDTYRKFRGKYQQDHNSGGSGGLGSFIFNKLHDAVNDIGSKLDPALAGGVGTSTPSHGGVGTSTQSYGGTQVSNPSQKKDGRHRYNSFATQRIGNDTKWFVDGCGYMWAVSRALEQATTSIWILDCKICTCSLLGLAADCFIN